MGSFDALKAFKVIREGKAGQRRGIFMKAISPPCGTKSGTDKWFPKKPVSLTPGERCAHVCP